MSIMDSILAILKGANPGSSDEDLQAKAAQLSNHPDAGSVVSPFDVSTSDNTVTQNGSLPSVAPSGPPAPTPTGGGQPASGVTGSWDAPVPTPTPAPVTPPAATAPIVPPIKAPEVTPPINLSTANDNAAREAEHARLEHQKRMNIIPAAIGGAGDAISKGLAAFGVKTPNDTQEKILTTGKETEEQGKKDFETKLQDNPNSDISKSYRQMVLQIAPSLAKEPNFQNMSAKAIGDKLPLIDTMMKAQAAKDAKELGLKQVKANKDVSLGLKENQQQDHLEQQAMQRIASLRGDQSLARIETQRDGAISAYTLLQQAKNEGRPLSQAEYYDLLGQLWKARSGAAPTGEAMRDLDSKTFKGDINKAATYFTGKPAGATTQGVLNNLQQFTKHTGDLLDQQHEAYMAPHLIKPAGLHDERWNPIKNTARGMSFSEAVKNAANKPKAPSKNDPMGIL